MNNWGEKLSFIWSIKEILRDHYRRHQYGQVILPLCVLRRLDCVLEPAKDQVLAKAATVRGDKDAAFDLLCHTSGQQFYNTSKFTFERLLGDEDNITDNVADYLRGFSPNVRDVVGKFGLHPHIEKMGRAGILYAVVGRFAEIDLHPATVPNLEMGYIYEELVRVTADLSNEEAGEHFTPREVIRLMVNLLVSDIPARAWPAAQFNETARALTAAGRRVVVTGVRGERPLTPQVADGGGTDIGGHTSPRELAAVLAAADVVVAGYTGPAHLAAAVGTPVVSLFARQFRRGGGRRTVSPPWCSVIRTRRAAARGRGNARYLGILACRP